MPTINIAKKAARTGIYLAIPQACAIKEPKNLPAAPPPIRLLLEFGLN